MALNNTVRIIGGKWRGKKLSFPANSPIRPTLDQIRETVFNWLQPYIADSVCLDAFTGSGALGIEALSRGAAHVTFIDHDVATLAQLKNNLHALNTHDYDSFYLKLPDQLSKIKSKAYDIIFLDPPFNTDLLDKTLDALASSELIKPSTLIYFETISRYQINEDNPWELVKFKKTKRIAYGLFKLKQKTIA